MRGEVRITKQALLAKDQELMHRTEVLGVYRDKMTKLAESIEQLQQVMARRAAVQKDQILGKLARQATGQMDKMHRQRKGKQ